MAFNTSFTDLGSIFGVNPSTSGTGSQSNIATAGTVGSEKLNIGEEAVNKIIYDILSGPEGLAAIFQGEQAAGIFNSSAAAQAAGDLTSKLAGEIAKLTAERVTVQDSSQTSTSTSQQQQQEDSGGGLLGGIGDFFGF